MLWTIQAAEKTIIVDYSKHDKNEWFNNTMYTDCKIMSALRWAKWRVFLTTEKWCLAKTQNVHVILKYLSQDWVNDYRCKYGKGAFKITLASSLSRSSSTLCESPLAAALTSSSTASPGTWVSKSFFNRADNLSAKILQTATSKTHSLSHKLSKSWLILTQLNAIHLH